MTPSAGESACQVSRARASVDPWASTFEVDWTGMPAELIQPCHESKVPESHLRGKMAKLLEEAIAVHDPAAKTNEGSKVASIVVLKYPCLFADTTSTGTIIVDTTSSLTRHLVVYLDSSRRPHRNTKRGLESGEGDDPAAAPSKQDRQTNTHRCVTWEPDSAPYTWDNLEVMKPQLCEATSLQMTSRMKDRFAFQ
ncbi:unnamed protein product [Ixodes pacificus]